jgi:hypothetical protein
MNLIENKRWNYTPGYFRDSVNKLARWVLWEGKPVVINMKDEDDKLVANDNKALSAEHHKLYLINLVSDERKNLDYLELIFLNDDGKNLRYAVNLKNYEIANEEGVRVDKDGDTIWETNIGNGDKITKRGINANKAIFVNMAKKVI